MKLKQKVIRIFVAIISAIVLSIGSYIAYFRMSDSLQSPPKSMSMENLFVAKQQKDIESIKTTKTILSCKNLYDNISMSLKEDKINDFVDDAQYQRLYKQLNFTFTERFIVLVDKYFEQSEWNDNDFAGKIITEIKRNGFVEYNTPNWNTLQRFENNIACYNEMLKCISKINAISINLKNNIPVDEISGLKNQKQNLVNQNCIKNRDIQSKLMNSYENMEKQAKANASLSITPTDYLRYDVSGGSKTVYINTNVSSWSYSSVDSWLSIRKSGSSLTITCTANPATDERTGSFEIKALEKTVKINIKQEAKKNITGNIDKVWVEGNNKGMNIHVKFSVNGMRNERGFVTAWFYFSDGNAITDKKSGTYRTANGQVAVYRQFNPTDDINDFVLFFPYSQFPLSSGQYDLKFKVGLFYPEGKQIATSEYKPISFRRSQI